MSDRVLADTNVLLRYANVHDPEHVLVRDAVRNLLLQGKTLHYTQQNRREFWNVATRPVPANGLGYAISQAKQNLVEVDATFQRLLDRPESGPEWDRLVLQHNVTGAAVHDAQLTASMLVHGVTHILTLDVGDFARYTEVAAIHPQDVLTPASPPGAAA